MIKYGKIFFSNTGNVVIEKTQFSFCSQILLRSKGLEAIRNSNPKYLSSITITKSSYLTEFNSSHNVTNLNKSTDAKNNSSNLLVDKKGQHYSKEEDEKLLDHVKNTVKTQIP